VHPEVTTLLQFPPEQVSVVAAFPSLQLALDVQQPEVGAYQLVHTPLTHASPVHASPSLHELALLLTCAQDPAEHTSSVQGLPSLEQDAVLFVWTQPVAGLQESLVHGLLSSQLMAVPAHVPPVHWSPDVQALASLQLVPLVAVGFEHTPVDVLHVPTTWH
jgi:hypothetical protein